MTALLQTLLEASVRVIPVAAFVGLVLCMARVRAGSVQHGAWSAVLCAMLLMPVLPYWVPAVSVAVPPSVESAMEYPIAPAPPEPPQQSTPSPAVSVSDVPAAPLSPSTPLWPGLLAVYIGGLASMLFRLLTGWRSARQLAPASALVRELPDQGPVYESPLLATPLTVGILAPRITLPETWRDWPAGKLRAVLAHEREHVRRRDPLMRFLAHVNRCIFWFHPLAWWLDRRLAASAEHACDDAGIRAMGESRQYAEVLLDLADTVRRNGGRFSWQGVGIDGDGLLEDRIDRIIRGDSACRVSRTRKAAVAVSCAASILLVAACRRAVTPLQDDPKIVTESFRQILRPLSAVFAANLTVEQVARLEAGLKDNPDDLDTRKKLLIFYWRSGQGKLGQLPTVKARRPHAIWLIEHHPDDELAGSAEALISPSDLDQLPDPAGYEQGKKAWLAQAGRPGVTAKVLGNAAAFVSIDDKPEAERLLLRAQSLDPQGGWASRLGWLYFEVLVGSNSRMPMGVVRSVSLADVHGAYANSIREKLAGANDVQLLTAVGESLAMRSRLRDLDFDGVGLGKQYLERALRLDPQSIGAKRALLITLRQENRPKPMTYEEVSKLPPAERFLPLVALAQTTCMRADANDYYDHDAAKAKAGWERAAQYAREGLELAPKARSDPEYGTGIFQANLVLGMVAMRNGDQKSAVRYMLDASRAPASEELNYLHQDYSFKLCQVLLKYGERASVVEYLERYARVNAAEKSYLLESAALIRNGKKPLWYRP